MKILNTVSIVVYGAADNSVGDNVDDVVRYTVKDVINNIIHNQTKEHT